MARWYKFRFLNLYACICMQPVWPSVTQEIRGERLIWMQPPKGIDNFITIFITYSEVKTFRLTTKLRSGVFNIEIYIIHTNSFFFCNIDPQFHLDSRKDFTFQHVLNIVIKLSILLVAGTHVSCLRRRKLMKTIFSQTKWGAVPRVNSTHFHELRKLN